MSIDSQEPTSIELLAQQASTPEVAETEILPSEGEIAPAPFTPEYEQDPAYQDLLATADQIAQNWQQRWNEDVFRSARYGMGRAARMLIQRDRTAAERIRDDWNKMVADQPELADAHPGNWFDVALTDGSPVQLWMEPYMQVAHSLNIAEAEERDAAAYQAAQGTEAEIHEVATSMGIEVDTTNTQEQLHFGDNVTAETARLVSELPTEVQQLTPEALRERQQQLKELPFVSARDTQMLTERAGNRESTFSFVPTDAIIGTVSPAFENWASEYDTRNGRVVEVASALQRGTEEDVEHVFHPTTIENDGIKLAKMTGPEGHALYVALDGTHRTAAAKLVEMSHIPATVEDVSESAETKTRDKQLANQWEQRIQAGLIKGHVEQNKDDDSYVLHAEECTVPWIVLPQASAIAMSKEYKFLYPDTLKNVKSFTTGETIPEDVFLDPIAMNFFVAGRWEEYTPADTKGRALVETAVPIFEKPNQPKKETVEQVTVDELDTLKSNIEKYTADPIVIEEQRALDDNPDLKRLYQQIIEQGDTVVLREKGQRQVQELQQIYMEGTNFFNVREKRSKKKKLDMFVAFVDSISVVRRDARDVKKFKPPVDTGNVSSYGAYDVLTHSEEYVYASFDAFAHLMARGSSDVHQLDMDRSAPAEIVMNDVANVGPRANREGIPMMQKYLANTFDFETGKQILAIYLATVFETPDQAAAILNSAGGAPQIAQQWDTFTKPFSYTSGREAADAAEYYRIAQEDEAVVSAAIDKMKKLLERTGIEPPISMEVRIRGTATKK